MSSPPDIDLIPQFMEGCAGSLFTLRTQPRGRPAKGGILYLHPYGEEMHKSRRMAALQARRFAAAGWSVLQFDLYGSGDSEGDAGDARWAIWRDDALAMTERLRQSSDGPIVLWGLRLGASLAVDAAQQRDDVRALLLWQPVLNGEQYLTHLLRLKLAGDLVKAGKSAASTQDLRKALSAGESLEIAGNRLSPELADAMTEFRLSAHSPKAPVHWMEMDMSGRTGLSPAGQQAILTTALGRMKHPESSDQAMPGPLPLGGRACGEGCGPTGRFSNAVSRIIQHWQTAGVAVTGRVLACPDFWQSQEIQECPALVDASLQAMQAVAA
ncbi:MAG TPA: hydrolase 2, exosortase A system-associated [Thiobacillaceae bacterium]|nr:hydrolase 2, exosortase A system-associated [Thiobacillaceae bacterium]